MKFSYKVCIMSIDFVGSHHLENTTKNDMGLVWNIEV